MPGKKSDKKKRTKDNIVGNIIAPVIAAAGLVAIGWIIGSIVIDNNNPFDKGLCNYKASSFVDYPIYHTILGMSKWNLYFDGYGVEGGEITVHGYWYVDGILRRKCDGDLKFTTTENFIPVMRQEHKITVLEQDCPKEGK